MMDPRMMAQALQGQQGGGMVGSPQQFSPQMMQQSQQQSAPPSALAAALRGGAAYNDASKGGLNRMLGMGGGSPNSAGGMVGRMGAAAGGGAGMGAPGPAAALPVIANAGNIGQAASNVTGNPMGLGDQAKAAGSFVQGDFGGAFNGLKDSVKNLFKVF
jgi:hypothetical protein